MEKLIESFISNYLYIALVIATFFSIIWIKKNKRLNASWIEAIVFGVIHTVIGLTIVRLFSRFELMFSPGNEEAQDGQSLYGGIIFMPAVYYIWAKLTKRDLKDVFDVMTISLIVTFFLARIVCLIEGCCLGKFLPGSNTLRWPTREAELLFYILFFAKFAKPVYRNLTKGEVYPIYLISYGIFRFIIEWLREGYDQVGLFHRGHFWSLLAMIVGYILYSEMKTKINNKTKQRKKKG